MRALGLQATELGPQGWLPTAPAERAAALAEHSLQAVGAFVPVVLHSEVDPRPALEVELDAFDAAGGDVLVLAAATGQDGYDERPQLTPRQWQHLLDNAQRVADLARERGITPALHPHVGTQVENREEVLRVLAGTDLGLCLDTGHLLVGGTDPVELVVQQPERISHVHAKDVRIELARRVGAGELGYTEAVKQGLYAPLGEGDVDLAAIVSALTAVGYDGWWVLEQDVVLTGPPQGEGPQADVRASMEHLRGLAGQQG
ncbi:TIM barrel protein [Auraticoccus sp. F435]|uniref:TIM barrel protein n=2 Tax=Auraticoccus cholistanensis TaxID=2656650 RepID=A0A6A9UWG9_9ACTN|nr:TIM barrel protein [Auraticoccus cholistanensis]